MSTKSQATERTTDHDTIQHWTEERGGKPATVRSTERNGKAGILRIEFPSRSSNDANLDPISWEEFFSKFDCANLAMIYQEKTAEGEQSFFCKFVNRETSEE
ncbi:MAG TPA: hypothetical protein VHX65_09755 [Pirellulales bacterium]|jgi:hypothetical protein|nr:hypothetical protein [Pirellulales bacterium]